MKYWVFAFLLCVAAAVGGDDTYGDLHVAEVVRVYDGDTFFANVSGVHPLIGKEVGIRPRGIDTPELSCGTYLKKAKTAKDTVKARQVCQLAQEAKAHFEKRLMGARCIVLKDVERPKYFRIMATIIVDGVDLGKEMVELGYAKEYDGGTKDSWF